MKIVKTTRNLWLTRVKILIEPAPSRIEFFSSTWSCLRTHLRGKNGSWHQKSSNDLIYWVMLEPWLLILQGTGCAKNHGLQQHMCNSRAVKLIVKLQLCCVWLVRLGEKILLRKYRSISGKLVALSNFVFNRSSIPNISSIIRIVGVQYSDSTCNCILKAVWAKWSMLKLTNC